jgi:peptide/nickel transport system ATP-binding protein/oligopeptide transport system ATP-binding protein
MQKEKPLLGVERLRTSFLVDEGVVRAVDGVTFRVSRGETVGVVGESGCGKSVTALSILRLIDTPRVRIEADAIGWDGNDLLRLTEKEMRRIRGSEIAMIFQDPFASLNPVLAIGEQLREAVRLHQGLDKGAASRAVVEALERVHIPSPAMRLTEYPHQISGGMQQRVMIAMALSCNPRLLIADEPTTALDVTIQAQIIDLLREIQDKTDMSLLLISHDLGVISELADRVTVMYAGKIVEEGTAEKMLEAPRHPYTLGLLNSVPRLGGSRAKLETIGGSVPNPLAYPAGCRFHPRCFMAETVCSREEPEFREVEAGRFAACWFSEKM